MGPQVPDNIRNSLKKKPNGAIKHVDIVLDDTMEELATIEGVMQNKYRNKSGKKKRKKSMSPQQYLANYIAQS